MEPAPSFLDFEASSLSPQSYPIEVAWNLADGSIESYLISPRDIDAWTEWDPEAELIHGIPRNELLASGYPPSTVCGFAIQSLADRTLYSDAPSYDGMWLAKLFSVCPGPRPTIQIRHVDELLIQILSPDGLRTANASARTQALAKIAALKIEARKQKPRRHRAAWDVEYLFCLWQLAKLDAGSLTG
ncbi:MAG TPA: transcriptional regulator [Blastocatellia bacterium]